MDLDELPIGERLDALLRQFDEPANDPDDELDYAQFVERRAQERSAHKSASEDELVVSEDEPALDSDADHPWLNAYNSDEEALASPLSSPRAPTLRANQKSTRPPKSKSKKPKQANASRTARPRTPPLPSPEKAVDEHVANVYADAGLSPTRLTRDTQQARRQTAKQTQRQLEEAARQDQRLERMLAGDISCYTVKTVTADDFLAAFDTTPSRQAPPSSPPKQAEKRFSEIVSSPPKMQGLRSFIAHGNGHEPRTTGSNDSDSDSDLEIIPETRAARTSQPIRELLRFGGGTAADRQLAATRAKLQQMERDQIVNRSKARVEKLKAQGFDVEAVANAMDRQRQRSAQGAEAWLAHVRQEADMIRAAERSDEGESDSGSELESEDSHANEQGEARNRKPRMIVLSDSEDDAEPEAAENAPEVQQSSLPSLPGSPSLPSLPGLSGLPKSSFGLDPDADTDEDEGDRSLAGATQYVAPLSPRSRAALFGSQIEQTNPNPGTSNSDILPDTLPDTLANTLPDTLPDTLRDTFADPGVDPALSSDLELELGPDSDADARVEPDLADLQNADISLSQKMAEVRQRYLRAENEQRRLQIKNLQTRTAAGAKSKLARSAFVEDQAEESDDEDGAGGMRQRADGADNENEDDDDDDIVDADLAELVDHRAVDVRASKLREKFADEERRLDERLLNRFVDGVNGGFRRQKARDANGLFLSDDDVEFDAGDDELLAYRQMLEQKRQEKLLGSSSRVARLAASERNQAFFKSITSELIARPSAAARTGTVQDGLQFLRSVADSKSKDSYVEPPRAAPPTRGAHNDRDAYFESEDGPATGLSKAIKVASLRQPRRASSRQSTVRDAEDSLVGMRRTTYASRIAAANISTGKTVEIMQSLGPAAQGPRPKKKYVASAASAPKRRQVVKTSAHSSGPALFRRSWT